MVWDPIIEQTLSIKKVQHNSSSIITKYETLYNILKLEPYDIYKDSEINDKMKYYKSIIDLHKSRVYKARMELILRHKIDIYPYR